MWLNRMDPLGKARTFIEGTEEEIEVRGEKTGVKALKLGGHFPGSLCVLAYGRLLVADTLVTIPAGLGDCKPYFQTCLLFSSVGAWGSGAVSRARIRIRIRIRIAELLSSHFRSRKISY